MLTRRIDAGVRRPLLTSGLIWGAWHLPLILSGQYASGPSPLLSAAMFLPTVVCGAYVAASVRLASGSVWPAVFFHGAWNAIIQGAFNRYTAGGGSSHGTAIWTGESGILVATASLLVTFVLVLRQRLPIRRTTGGEPGELVRVRDL
jgi:membrane protease YdiL (CAAX protease family)